MELYCAREALVVTALFGIGRWLYPASLPTEERGRGSSSLCSLYIVLVTLLTSSKAGITAFGSYIALDTLVRASPLDAGMLLHHAVGGVLALSGSMLLFSSTTTAVEPIVRGLLCMEATTPLLHWAWARHQLGADASRHMAAVLVIWVPLRLLEPLRALKALLLLLGSWPWQTTNWMLLCSVAVVMLPLATLQWLWFYKLLAIAMRGANRRETLPTYQKRTLF